MLCIWWCEKGVIYWELLPENTTLNAIKYRAQLEKLETEVVKKGWFSDKIYFQHDNAKPHVSKIVTEKIAEFGWELLPHPPYSPDLAPSDYHLFRSLSNYLRGKNFKNEEVLKIELQKFFDSKPQEFYAKGIHDLPRRWAEVIKTKGEYILDKLYLVFNLTSIFEICGTDSQNLPYEMLSSKQVICVKGYVAPKIGPMTMDVIYSTTQLYETNTSNLEEQLRL